MGNRIRNAFEGVVLDEKRKETIINDVIDGTMKESKMKGNKMSFWSGRLGGAAIVVAAVLVFVVVNLVMFGGNGKGTPAVSVTGTEETTSKYALPTQSDKEGNVDLEKFNDPITDISDQFTEAAQAEGEVTEEIVHSNPADVERAAQLAQYLPVKNATVTAVYGMKYVEMHEGIDLTSQDTNIYAPMSGTIIFMQYDTEKGNMLIMDHGNGVTSEYHHLADLKNELLDTTVSQGDIIGTMGTTGYSTGLHLHWEIRIDNVSINPLDYIENNN